MAESLINSIVWNTNQIIPIKRYKENCLTTPNIVKISEVENTVQLPKKLTAEPLFLHSIVPHKKVICQCVDFVAKDGQLYFSDQRFSIPLKYTGWFEILSEDGKAIQPCKTIEQIAGNSPERFLVRSKTKAYLSEENGDPNYDKTRTVQKGEVMAIIGKINVTLGWRKQKKHFLHCLDSNGIDIYFDFKATGQFSPMAGSTDISGMHSIEGLISRFRLPLTVRVVSGQIPKVASENERPGLLRITEIQKDNIALFLPLQSNQRLIPISIRTNIHLTAAANKNELTRIRFYKHLAAFCDTKVEKYYKTMQVLVSTKSSDKEYNACTLPSRTVKGSELSTRTSRVPNPTEEDILFAEVDDLYAYVRRGGEPPKPRPRSWATAAILESEAKMNNELKSSSQPILSTNGRPRGLLATLTAGKFPTKPNSLIRQQKVASPTTETTYLINPRPKSSPQNLPSAKDSILKAFIDKYRSVESVVQTEVDPFVDERHYQNFETIEQAMKAGLLPRQQSIDEVRRNSMPDPLLRSQSVQNLMLPSPTKSKVYFTHELMQARHSGFSKLREFDRQLSRGSIKSQDDALKPDLAKIANILNSLSKAEVGQEFIIETSHSQTRPVDNFIECDSPQDTQCNNIWNLTEPISFPQEIEASS